VKRQAEGGLTDGLYAKKTPIGAALKHTLRRRLLTNAIDSLQGAICKGVQWRHHLGLHGFGPPQNLDSGPSFCKVTQLKSPCKKLPEFTKSHLQNVK